MLYTVVLSFLDDMCLILSYEGKFLDLALEKLHSNGMHHGDIAFCNIVIGTNGIVKLIDFVNVHTMK